MAMSEEQLEQQLKWARKVLKEIDAGANPDADDMDAMASYLESAISEVRHLRKQVEAGKVLRDEMRCAVWTDKRAPWCRDNGLTMVQECKACRAARAFDDAVREE